MATLLWLDAAAHRVSATQETVERAREFEALGFSPLDALHVACAENSAARWFVTTDDRLLKRARLHRERITVEVLAPDQVAPLLKGDET